MTDSAEKNFNLHVVFAGFAALDRSEGKRRLRACGGVGLRVVHFFHVDAPRRRLVACLSFFREVIVVFAPVPLCSDQGHSARIQCMAVFGEAK